MLKIDGKTFMNIQEAVQWLLDNNALPFQCTADYVANTEIGMGTIVNPSPAKVRIGSLIFFADSKVSTVVGITENGFICSDKYNNLVDDVAYVTGVAIDASGHLITTFSDGQTQDAGLIKQISSFSINASQHLVANYNDGTTQDLGEIFSGNISVSGYIEQGTANYDSGNLSISSSNPNTLTYRIIFSKFQIVNQTLKAVMILSVKNETASPINFMEAVASIADLPLKYRGKIFDVVGNTLNATDNQTHLIRANMATVTLADSSMRPVDTNGPIAFALSHYNQLLAIRFKTVYTGVEIPANTEYYFFGEMNLTLI